MALIVDIEKTLGDFHLKVNFTAEREVMALLGVSGCGKSMTLGCIAGIVRPDKGHIELNGRVLFDSEKKIDLPPQKRKVGYLFQQYASEKRAGAGGAGGSARVPPGGTGEQPSESAVRWSAAAVRDGAHSGRAA